MRLPSASLAGFFVLFAFLYGIAAVFLLVPAIRQQSFEPVAGTITRSEAISCSEPGAGSYPEIVFAYKVDGIRYVDGGHRLETWKTCLPADEVDAVLKRYPVGAEVEAWYDPRNPKVAVLETDLGIMQKIFLGVGAGFFFIFGLAYLWEAPRKPRQRRSKSTEEPGDSGS